MAHFLEDGADRDSVFGIDEAGPGFGFLDRGHDGVNDFAVDKNWCIVRWGWVIRADGQFWFPAIAGACFGFVEVRCIGVHPEVHLGGFVLDASIRMSGGIIKKLVDAEDDVFPRAGGDGRGDGADGGLHGVINGVGIVDEDAG